MGGPSILNSLRSENDVDAVAYAQSNASRSAIVEVWKGDALVTRLLPVTSARA